MEDYSKYERDKAVLDLKKGNMEIELAQLEQRLADYGAELESIRKDSSYNEEERVEAIKDYEKIIAETQINIDMMRENLGLIEVNKVVAEELRQQADRVLREDEPDPLVADIENEGKPPRKVN